MAELRIKIAQCPKYKKPKPPHHHDHHARLRHHQRPNPVIPQIHSHRQRMGERYAVHHVLELHGARYSISNAPRRPRSSPKNVAAKSSRSFSPPVNTI